MLSRARSRGERAEWRLAVSVERASCCVGPSVAVCVAVCERLRREVWRVRPVPRAAGERPQPRGSRGRSVSRPRVSSVCVFVLQLRGAT